jgi:DNA-directed RNA polymerase subunit M/transcription elongation factor TFIIS
MTDEKTAELYTSPGGKFIRADSLPRILAHWQSFRAPQKRTHSIKYEGELYSSDEVDKLQRLRLKAELNEVRPVSSSSKRHSMPQNNILKEISFPDVPCRRCEKTMAFERLYYAVADVAAVQYKCLSCGYEETRPGKVPDLPE